MACCSAIELWAALDDGHAQMLGLISDLSDEQVIGPRLEFTGAALTLAALSARGAKEQFPIIHFSGLQTSIQARQFPSVGR